MGGASQALLMRMACGQSVPFCVTWPLVLGTDFSTQPFQRCPLGPLKASILSAGPFGFFCPKHRPATVPEPRFLVAEDGNRACNLDFPGALGEAGSHRRQAASDRAEERPGSELSSF